MNRGWIVVLFFSFIFPSEAISQTYIATIVKKGAFLIHEEPNLIIKGRRTRGLKTYLPVGTVAIAKSQLIKIKDNKTKIPAFYSPVITNAGINGLLRQDLYEKLPPGKWLVATTEETITILQPRKQKARSSFSKRAGKYVRVLEKPNTTSSYYKVSLPWAKDSNGNEDVGRIDADYIAEGSLVYVNTAVLEEFVEKTPFVEPVYTQLDVISGATDKLLGNTHEWIIKKLKSKYGGDVSKLVSYLKNVALSPCDIELKATVELDGTFLGSGLRLELPLSLKRRGHVYQMDAYRPNKFESNLGKHFVVFRDISCKGNIPNRMNSMVIQGNNMEGLDVILDNLPSTLNKRWDSNFKSEKFRSRMVLVDGAEQYNKLFDYIVSQATPGTWLGKLKNNELNTFTAYLISIIAHFEKA